MKTPAFTIALILVSCATGLWADNTPIEPSGGGTPGGWNPIALEEAAPSGYCESDAVRTVDEDRIRMESEIIRLKFSGYLPVRVTVEYVFRNLTDEPVSRLMGFPITDGIADFSCAEVATGKDIEAGNRSLAEGAPIPPYFCYTEPGCCRFFAAILELAPGEAKTIRSSYEQDWLFQYVSTSQESSYPAYVDYVVETGGYWAGNIGKITVELEGVKPDGLGDKTAIPYYWVGGSMTAAERAQMLTDLMNDSADAMRECDFLPEPARYQTGFAAFWDYEAISSAFSRVAPGIWRAEWENVEPRANFRFQRPALPVQANGPESDRSPATARTLAPGEQVSAFAMKFAPEGFDYDRGSTFFVPDSVDILFASARPSSRADALFDSSRPSAVFLRANGGFGQFGTVTAPDTIVRLDGPKDAGNGYVRYELSHLVTATRATLSFEAKGNLKVAEIVPNFTQPKDFFAKGMIVNDAGVRARQGPGTDAAILAVLAKGTRLTYRRTFLFRETIGGDDDLWYEVTLPDGRTGFVFGAFVDRAR